MSAEGWRVTLCVCVQSKRHSSSPAELGGHQLQTGSKA